MIIEDKITVKQILKENYNKFKNKYWFQVPKHMREHIYDVVNKALMCSDIKYGFAEYRCVICGGSTKVPFTCKSKFCNSNRCGRLYKMKNLGNLC
ncbi:transposase zinc-binding domain-containing protein [Clostridium sp.]|uniref:transposase zinc-binding domain-containing protein n=1 Tax=Clostridium sp. TaxID=1506 RepID=UPI001ECE6EE3|nr:transposase zinc-binding domain-containing protein [Clostridium sp.]